MNGPRLTMQFYEADISQVEDLPLQAGTYLEQKLDGARCLTVITPGLIRFLSRNGKTLQHAASVQHLHHLREALAELADQPVSGMEELVLDGELLPDTGTYVLFDVPYARADGAERIVPSTPFKTRRAYLESLDPFLPHDGSVTIVRQARTATEKRLLIADAIEHGAEGLMVKLALSPYEPGKRVRHSLKVKFVKTADLIVTEVNRPDPQHGHARLAAYREVDGQLELVDVGSCSMIGKPEVQRGDVIEVAYLYWTGTRLYQPRMKKVRRDKTMADCTLDQLTLYTKCLL
jgi:ATP-dependent DNA ligase